MPTILSDDLLIEIFKFSDRFNINQNFEFVNVHWARCILAVEQSHLPLYKMYKIWLCPLFCALHYTNTMQPTEDTILKEVFKDCSDSCRQNYLEFISDEWPAQRIPFCMYTQKTLLDPGSLKKVTFNYDNWRIERPENAHFFYHFCDICFEEAYLDVYNDRSLTLFLLDCPIFKLRTGHLSIRSSTEQLSLELIEDFVEQKVVLPKLEEAIIGQNVSLELEEPGDGIIGY